MRKTTYTTSSRNKRRFTKKWKNQMEIVESSSPPIDLSPGAPDDGWGDDLDSDDDLSLADDPKDTDPDDDEDDLLGEQRTGTSAIERMRSIAKRNVVATAHKSKKSSKQRSGRSSRSSRISKRKVRTVKIIRAVLTIGPHTMPEANDRAGRSLWRCHSVDEVIAEHTKWDANFRKKCMKAIERRRLPDDLRCKIVAILDGAATDAPLLTSHKVLALAWQAVFRALYALAKDDPDMEFALVTFITRDGGTSSDAPVVKLQTSDDRVLRICRSMGKNFIGITELAMFNSLGHPDGGRHIQGHEHVLFWGHGAVAKAQGVAQRRMTDLPPNVTNAPQIDVRSVPATEINLARICAYLFKSPHKSMNWNPPRDGKPGHMNQSEKGDRMIRYLRMAMIRSIMTIEDVMFAGGAGIKIRKSVIDLLRQTCHSDVPVQNRLLHPDSIPAFWTEVIRELRRIKWRLPVIARRP